jgi:hypothetical protein
MTTISKHIVSAEELQYKGLRLVGFIHRKIKRANLRKNYNRFKGQFGIFPVTAGIIYEDLQKTNIKDASIEGSDKSLNQFLMAINYFRKYPTEDDLEKSFNYCNF